MIHHVGKLYHTSHSFLNYKIRTRVLSKHHRITVAINPYLYHGSLH